MNIFRKIAVSFLALLILFAPAMLDAQPGLSTAPATIALSFAQSESLTMTPSVNSLAFSPSTGLTPTFTVTVNWNFSAARTIEVAAYFGTGANALTGTAGNNITTDQVYGTAAGVGSGPCNTSGPAAPWVPMAGNFCGFLIYSGSAPTPAGVGAVTSPAYNFSVPSYATIAADSYSGNISIIAQAN